METPGKKQSRDVGFYIRSQLSNEWDLVPCYDRTLAVRKITRDDKRFQKCQDCGCDANLIVVELCRFTPKGRRAEVPLVWGWCGVCDIEREVHEN